MNIKLKAGIDVVATIAGFMFVGFTVRQILQSLSDAYGADAVANGAIFLIGLFGIGFTTVMLYKIRLNDLQYRAKLNEMVKK